MSDATSSKSFSWLTFAAIVGAFAIFVIILLVAYLPKKPEPLPDGVRTPAERKAALAELRGHEQTMATTYGWVDPDQKTIVRIPIEEAMRLTVRDLNAK